MRGPDPAERISLRDEGEIRQALRLSGVGADRRLRWTGRGSPLHGLVYEACSDEYDFGDRPGHPSVPCATRSLYRVSSRDGAWVAERIEPPPTLVFDCMTYVQIVEGPWSDAEVGLRIPLPNRVPG